jgi:hypothetical protein
MIGGSHYTTTTFSLVLETLTPAAADWHTPAHGSKLLSWHIVWGNPSHCPQLTKTKKLS